MVAPYTVRPGTATSSMLLRPEVTPYTVRPRTLGRPDWITQRFYFRNTTDADVAPAYDAAWDNTTLAVRRRLSSAPLSTGDSVAFTGLQAWTAGQTFLSRQYVSGILRSGVVLDAATVTMYTRVGASNPDDNAYPHLGVRVCSADGSIIRATILPVGDYGRGTEYTNPGGFNKQFASAEPLSSYTTTQGDRLVVEVGSHDISGTTPQASILFGSGGTSDLPEDETSATATNPWIEFRPAA